MRRSRAVSLVAIGAAAAVVVGACGTAPDAGGEGGGPGQTTDSRNGTAEGAVRGGTLNMLGIGDVDYLDPNITYYTNGNMVSRLLTRQLFAYPAEPGKTTTATPDLAEQAPTTENGGISADGKTITITLKKGVQWNTNPPRDVVASDFIRGVERTCNPVQPFGGLPDYIDIFEGFQAYCDAFATVGQDAPSIKAYIQNTPFAGITAKDDYTVVMTMTKPVGYIADVLTLPAMTPAPIESLDYVPGSAEYGKAVISSGPYKVDLYDPTKRIEMSRNPVWKPELDPIRGGFVDKIIADETLSQESVQQQLQTGSPNADMQFDALTPPSQIPGLLAAKDPGFNLGDTASSNPYVVYNIKSPNNNAALANVKVRQALSYGINRDNIIQVLGGPDVDPPLTHVIPPALLGGAKPFDPYPYDVAKSKQLLAEAGFPNGLTIKILYRNASEASSKAFQTLQQDLKQVGITVEGVPSPNADFYTKYLQVPDVAGRGVFDMAIGGWGADWYGNGAITYFKPLFSGQPSFPPIGSNYGYYDNPAVNTMINEAAAATDEGQAADLWAKVDAAVMADAPIFPITYNRDANYHAAQVHNAVHVESLQNFDPANVWLDPAKSGG